jgi:hypothetical protein
MITHSLLRQKIVSRSSSLDPDIDLAMLTTRAFFTVKTISFEKSEIKHPLPIYLSEQGPGSELTPEDPEQSATTLWMNNPEHIGIKNVISYVKYLMRTEVSSRRSFLPRSQRIDIPY